ncbi:MAG: SIMPL domain-containing protein [Mangrovicoccus sp.]|nr:SIMPL domain-containing protein [Mangrovicoccus sp.]
MRQSFLAILAACCLSSPVLAAEHAPQITVTGAATTQAAPDMAILEFGAGLRADTAQAAMDEAGAITAALLQAMQDQGVDAADIQTRRVGLRPIFSRDGQGYSSGVPAGFEASSMLSVQVRDLSKLSEIYGAASAAGATDFQGLRFDLADPSEAHREARLAAVADAKARAEAYAEAAGLELGAVLSMGEPGQMGGPVPMRAAMMMDATEGMPVAPGSVSINAQITVVYALTE